MKVLITGGAGFIGSRLARNMLARGHEITILDNFSPQIHAGQSELPADLKSVVQLIRGDVRDIRAWESAMEGQQVLVHLAAETGTGQSMYEVSRYEQVNLAGTAHFFQLLASKQAKSIEKIVVASSRAIYGEGAYLCPSHGLVYPSPRSFEEKQNGQFDPNCPRCDSACSSAPTPEDAPLQPSSFYGLTKQVQEQMFLMFGSTFGIPALALRYQNVYGPGQSLQNPYTGILAIFSNLARTGERIRVFEDGCESRDFVYIDDVVEGTRAAVESAILGSHSVNIGSGTRVSVIEVADRINNYYGAKSSVEITGEFRQGDVRHGMAELKRAQNLLGYQPCWSFKRGLEAFLSWANQHEPSHAGYEHSLTEMKNRGLLYAK